MLATSYTVGSEIGKVGPMFAASYGVGSEIGKVSPMLATSYGLDSETKQWARRWLRLTALFSMRFWV